MVIGIEPGSDRATVSLTVISAGLSNPSTSQRLADRISAAVRVCAQQTSRRLRLERIEIRDLARDVTDALLTGERSGLLERAIAGVTGADALVAVTPVFNGSYSGLFKSFLDLLPPRSLTGVPVLIAATGGSHRHSLMLDYAVRPVFGYLGALTVPTEIFAAAADLADPVTDAAITARADRAAGELLMLTRARSASGDDQARAGLDGTRTVRQPSTNQVDPDPATGRETTQTR